MYRFMLILGLMLCVGMGGCNRKPDAHDAAHAIEVSKELHYEQEKMDYLGAQAERFLENYQYADAIEVVNYLFDHFDRHPMMAKVVLERAKKGLEAREKEMREYREKVLDRDK